MDLSLEQIENDFWGRASPGASYLVRTVHRLRSKPVADLEAEDLRIMVGQNVGLDVLVPIALKGLEREPLLEGDYYPGDLLVAVLRTNTDYWNTHPSELDAIEKILTALECSESRISEAVKSFRSRVR